MEMKDMGRERRAAVYAMPASLFRDDLARPVLRCDSQRRDDAAIEEIRRGSRTDVRRPRRPNDALPDERVREYRRRIETGSYDTAEVAEEVARRILERGDL